jgi:hypothetical protein
VVDKDIEENQQHLERQARPEYASGKDICVQVEAEGLVLGHARASSGCRSREVEGENRDWSVGVATKVFERSRIGKTPDL